MYESALRPCSIPVNAYIQVFTGVGLRPFNPVNTYIQVFKQGLELPLRFPAGFFSFLVFCDVFDDTVNPVDLSFCIEMGSRRFGCPDECPVFPAEAQEFYFAQSLFPISLQ